jgi:mono/diheme cytochrome c family protein
LSLVSAAVSLIAFSSVFDTRHVVRRRRSILPLLWFVLIIGGSVTARGQATAPPSGSLPVARSGADVYRAACATCHAPDGRGSPQSVVGFEAPLPDFSDCSFATGEPDPDWYAVVHEGGPVRALDRHMPAFGDALTSTEITLAIGHIRTFCTEPAWPQGDLNLPRAFFTEKAFPENEAVWMTGITGGDDRSVQNVLVYERRFGARNQVELVVPVTFAKSRSEWTQGLGDVAVAFKRTLHANLRRGQISAAGMEVILPTGNEQGGFGNGHTVFEPFAMWGQVLPRNAFVQMHVGAEFPTDTSAGAREVFVRSALGTTIATNRGFGRAWSPQVEVLWARPEGGSPEWDVVPQMQVTLSKLQHVMLAIGVRVPVNRRDDRKPQALVYLLWDWFDGGFFEMWR